MLETLLDRASSLLDRRFLTAYWFPVFISSSIFVLIIINIYGQEAGFDWWQQYFMIKNFAKNLIDKTFIVVYLVAVTILAYFLQHLTRPIIQFYEGYWPLGLHEWFTDLPIFGERSNWTKVSQRSEAERKQNHEYYRLLSQLFYNYPPRENLIMPTKLGNTLRAAEFYSAIAYGMESNFWWPRLWPLLSDVVKNQIIDSLVPVVALLNFSSLIVVVSLFGFGYTRQVGFGWYGLLIVLGGLIIAFLSYRVAVVHAQNYGETIRVTIDLYRFDLLKALHIPLPDTVDEEQQTWERLLLWLYIDPKFAAGIEYNHNKNS